MNLSSAIVTLNSYTRSQHEVGIDARAQLVVAMVYILAVVTVPILDTAMLVWMLCYPIIMAEAFGIGYDKILVKSLWILPLVMVIGVFNPIFDREPMWCILGINVSRGWVSFISLTLRGLLTVQALLILICCSGFMGICRSLSSIGVPQILVSQLMMMYRFLIVVLDEALVMHRSRQSRGFGRRSYPLAMWGTFVGQLLLRSMHRASRVNRSMIARGYDGTLRYGPSPGRLRAVDYAYIAVWIIVIAVIRFTPLTTLITI